MASINKRILLRGLWGAFESYIRWDSTRTLRRIFLLSIIMTPKNYYFVSKVSHETQESCPPTILRNKCYTTRLSLPGLYDFSTGIYIRWASEKLRISNCGFVIFFCWQSIRSENFLTRWKILFLQITTSLAFVAAERKGKTIKFPTFKYPKATVLR